MANKLVFFPRAPYQRPLADPATATYFVEKMPQYVFDGYQDFYMARGLGTPENRKTFPLLKKLRQEKQKKEALVALGIMAGTGVVLGGAYGIHKLSQPNYVSSQTKRKARKKQKYSVLEY